MPSVERKVPAYEFDRAKGLVRMKDLIRFAKFVARFCGFKVSADGLDMQEIADGVHIKASGSSTSTRTHPFLCVPEGAGFRIYPGTWDGEPPTVGGLALTESLTMALGAGVQHVYLVLEYLLTASEGGYVYSVDLQSAQISVQGSLESSPTSHRDTFYVLIASFNDGVKTAQYVTSSLSGSVCDDGTGDGLANLQIAGA